MAVDAARVEAFYNGARQWRAEMAAFRAILQASPLTEEFKWRAPCYTFEGANVATVWGLKGFCGLSFFKGVLLKDAAGLLVAPGDNSRSVRMFTATDPGQIAAAQAALAGYVLEAIAVERAGKKVVFAKDDLDGPPELEAALAADAALRAAFDALTPGRQRGYRLLFSGAKQAATRAARIAKARPRILDGKGMHDR